MACPYLLMIKRYLLTWLCSIIWIYQQLDDSRKVSRFFLDTSWFTPTIHFFAFLTSKYYSTVLQHEKVKTKQPITSVIHGLKKMEQRTFLHQRNQFSDMDRYATAKIFCIFVYTLVYHFINHLHHSQSS